MFIARVLVCIVIPVLLCTRLSAEPPADIGRGDASVVNSDGAAARQGSVSNADRGDSELGVSDVADLPPVSRALHLSDLDDILWASQVLVSKRCQTFNDRYDAQLLLSAQHHVRCLPALLAVAHDEEDNPQLRLDAVKALATYPPEYVVEHLIVLIADRHRELAEQAHKALYHLTERAFSQQDLGVPDTREERKQLREAWSAWWKEHRTEVVRGNE